jgi:large subunit ribosomal protein L10
MGVGEVSLPTQHKIDQVADLTALLQDAEIAIGASYKGLRVSDLTALRRQMSANGIQVRVVKNTLLRRAAANVGNEQFGELAQQDTAILVGSDIVETARQVATYRREHLNTPFTVRNAVVSGTIVDAAYVEDLSTVPPRDELLARIAGGLTGKIRELAGLLQATTRDFAGLVEARAAQLEGQQ